VNGVPSSWDANGNLLSDSINTYTYDHANRLIGVSDGQDSYAFAYNGLGDRLQQTTPGGTTNYTLDLNAGLTQVLADGTNTFLYGLGRIGQQGADWAYHLPDALGSVRQLADPTGAVISAQSYEPYGESLGAFGSPASSYGFAGEWTDATGLQYLRARYYAPEVARFIGRDLWAGASMNPVSYNSWLYAYANPINLVDPSGKCPDIDGDGTCDPMWWLTRVPSPPEPEIYTSSTLANTVVETLSAAMSYVTCPPVSIANLVRKDRNYVDNSGQGERSYDAGLSYWGKNMMDLWLVYRDVSGWWNDLAGNFDVMRFVTLMLAFELQGIQSTNLQTNSQFKDDLREAVARNYYEYSNHSFSNSTLLNWIGEYESAKKKWRAVFSGDDPKELVAKQTRRGELNWDLAWYAVQGIYVPKGTWNLGAVCNRPYSWGNQSLVGSKNKPPEGYLYAWLEGDSWYLFTQLQAETFRNNYSNCAERYGIEP
jgi:RHS repeat-associated protein